MTSFQLMACIVVYAITAGCIAYAIARLPRVRALSAYFSPTNLTVIGAAFIFFTSFIAAEVYNDRSRVLASIDRETGALRQLVRIATTVSDSDLANSIRAYVRSVHDDEWPVLWTGEPHPATEEAFLNLAYAAARFGEGRLYEDRLNSIMDAIYTARYERIDLARASVSPVKWVAFCILGLAAMIAVAIVNAARLDAKILALCLYGTVVMTVLSVIAIQDRPFSAPLQIEPDGYRKIELALKPAHTS